MCAVAVSPIRYGCKLTQRSVRSVQRYTYRVCPTFRPYFIHLYPYRIFTATHSSGLYYSVQALKKDLETLSSPLPAHLQTFQGRGKDMPSAKAAGQIPPEASAVASKCSRNRSKASCGNCYRRKQKVCQTSRAASREGFMSRCEVLGSVLAMPPKHYTSTLPYLREPGGSPRRRF